MSHEGYTAAEDADNYWYHEGALMDDVDTGSGFPLQPSPRVNDEEQIPQYIDWDSLTDPQLRETEPAALHEAGPGDHPTITYDGKGGIDPDGELLKFFDDPYAMDPPVSTAMLGFQNQSFAVR